MIRVSESPALPLESQQCPRCRTRGQTWNGGAPKCGFPQGVFDEGNWNCATLNALRDLVDETRALWSEDQYAALILLDGDFIVLGWYKHRGRTEEAWLMSDGMQPLTLDDAERFLAAYTPHPQTSGRRDGSDAGSYRCTR
jgi:hypothetical protein